MGLFKKIGKGISRTVKGVGNAVRTVAKSGVGKTIAVAGATALLPGIGTTLVGGAVLRSAISTGSKLLKSPSIQKPTTSIGALLPLVNRQPPINLTSSERTNTNITDSRKNDTLDRVFNFAKYLLSGKGNNGSGTGVSNSSDTVRNTDSVGSSANTQTYSFLTKLIRLIKSIF